MAGDFLKLVGGVLSEALAIVTTAGAGDAGKIVKTDAAGKLDASLMPDGIAAEQRDLVASEALSAGDLVNVWDDAGTAKMRKADADTISKKAHGFVKDAVSSGATGKIYPEENVITGLSGLTIGATYFLSQTAGGVTTTAPTGANVISQSVGYALSATELLFRPGSPIVQVA